MKYNSHGKLLIAGEYLVLKGATALAIPVNFGQSLQIEKNESSGKLLWESYENGKHWFTGEFSNNLLEIVSSSDTKIAHRLRDILQHALELNPSFQELIPGNKVISNADFDLAWGLGSSSSLISNIAFWADVDPFLLHSGVSQGSGFDVIAARADGPIFFKLKKEGYEVTDSHFNPNFKNKIYFIYLGSKQDSAESVSQFGSKKKSFKSQVQLISELARHISLSMEIEDFEYYIKEHELIVSSVLKKKSIKESGFGDLNGEIKSLGAWGGDFAMITWHGTKSGLVDYLKNKNIKTFFTFDEIVKIR